MAEVNIQVSQESPTTSYTSVRGHEVLIDRPEAKGGSDKGAMGGELLLVALGGCFMSNLLEAVRTREAAISNMQASITGTLDGSPARFTEVSMRVSGDYEDKELFEKLVTISERSCIVANSLKDGLKLSVIVE
ncbi:MAG: OsmC family protein [Chloroflexota bacterium]